MHRLKFQVCAIVTALVMLAGVGAQAQTTSGTNTTSGTTTKDTTVKAKGVGIAGGAVVGAEVVLLVESAIKVKPVWAWIAFPVVGAAGGGVGGYFLRKKSAGGAIALFATGMAAVIPTAVAVASARSFDPEVAGAVPAGNVDGGLKYSFEEEPAGVTAKGADETVTEVEARPEGASEEGPPPPVPSEQGVDDGVESVPAGEDGGDTSYEQTIESYEQDKRIAHLSSGALLHVDPKFGFGFGVPSVDVMPSVVYDNSPFQDAVYSGLQVNMSILNMNLP